MYGLRVPASRVGYVPEAQGGLPPGPHLLYVLATRTRLGHRYGPRTLAPQVEDIESNVQRVLQWMQQWAADHQ